MNSTTLLTPSNNTKKQSIVIYVHGFRSSGRSEKTGILAEAFGPNFLSPSLPVSPELAMHSLDQLLGVLFLAYNQVILIGSSLGGFYSLALLKKHHERTDFRNGELKVILMNPAVHVDRKGDKLIGMHVDFNGAKFEVTEQNIEELKQMKAHSFDEIIQKSSIMVMVEKGDTVIDWNEAVEFLPHATHDIEEGGSHRFDNLLAKIPVIQRFIDS